MMSVSSPSAEPDAQPPAGPAPRAARPFKPDQATHWSLLISSSVIVSLALLMNTRGEEQVIVPVINRPLPPLCMTKRYLEVDCPGCGLTRCFISLAHGDVARAWHYNPAGLWFFTLVAAQIPYRAVQLFRIRSGKLPLRFAYGNWPLWVLLFLLIGQWVVKLALQAV